MNTIVLQSLRLPLRPQTSSRISETRADHIIHIYRWLRHKGRLTPNYSKRETFLSICAIFFAIVGAAGLIFLSIFDTKNYPRVHDGCLVIFVYVNLLLLTYQPLHTNTHHSGGYIISSIFVCAEYQRLGIHFRDYRTLRISFWIKLAFVVVEVALAVSFAVTQYQGQWNVSGVLEWIIALIYILWVWSFILDFLPATRTRHAEDRFPRVRKDNDPNALRTQENGSVSGGPVYSNGGHPGGNTQQPMAENGRFSQPASRNF